MVPEVAFELTDKVPAVDTSGSRTFQAEGVASTKDLRQRQSCHEQRASMSEEWIMVRAVHGSRLTIMQGLRGQQRVWLLFHVMIDL